MKRTFFDFPAKDPVDDSPWPKAVQWHAVRSKKKKEITHLSVEKIFIH